MSKRPVFSSLVPLCLVALTAGVVVPTSAAVAQQRGSQSGEAAAALVEEGGKLVVKSLRSLFSEHTRFYPQGNRLVLPLRDLGGSRISFNFNHRSWAQPGGPKVLGRVTIHGVPDSMRDSLRLVLKADKQGRKDRDRNDGRIVRHGSMIEFSAGTSGDRALYFVERGSSLAGQLPPDAYVVIERRR